MTPTNETFDPDKCYLSKDQVIGVGNDLIKRWEADPKANFWLIRVAKAMQFVLGRTSEKVVEQYYREAFKMVYYIMQKNASASDPTLSKLPPPSPPKPQYVVPEKRERVAANLLRFFEHGAMKD